MRVGSRGATYPRGSVRWKRSPLSISSAAVARSRPGSGRDDDALLTELSTAVRVAVG